MLFIVIVILGRSLDVWNDLSEKDEEEGFIASFCDLKKFNVLQRLWNFLSLFSEIIWTIAVIFGCGLFLLVFFRLSGWCWNIMSGYQVVLCNITLVTWKLKHEWVLLFLASQPAFGVWVLVHLPLVNLISTTLSLNIFGARWLWAFGMGYKKVMRMRKSNPLENQATL